MSDIVFDVVSVHAAKKSTPSLATAGLNCSTAVETTSYVAAGTTPLSVMDAETSTRLSPPYASTTRVREFAATAAYAPLRRRAGVGSSAAPVASRRKASTRCWEDGVSIYASRRSTNPLPD